MKGKINWYSENVILEKRVFLFCFGFKCMTGRINTLKKIEHKNEYEIYVEFIEPDYLNNELINGNNFTINEGSKILGKGTVN